MTFFLIHTYTTQTIENAKSVQHITQQPHRPKICISYTAFSYYNYKMKKKALEGDANTAPQLACSVITIGKRMERAKKTNAKSIKLRVGLRALARASDHCQMSPEQSPLRQQQLVSPAVRSLLARCNSAPFAAATCHKHTQTGVYMHMFDSQFGHISELTNQATVGHL